MKRLFALFLIVSIAAAVEPEPAQEDTLFADTTLTVQLSDSTSLDSNSLTSGWLLPLSVIGATAGVFIFLFTARSK